MKKEIYRSPWFDLEGYLACTVKYSDGTKRTVLQHREIMEKHLNKKLPRNILVHHKNEDKKDNRVGNFELKPIEEHSRLHRPEIEFVNVLCVYCGKKFVKQAKEERNRLKKGRQGPFCGKSCAGKWGRENQIKNGMANLRKHDSKKEF